MPSLSANEVFQIVFGLITSLVSLLLFGNLFFLKKLISKVDQIDPLAITIGALTRRIDELCKHMEIVNDLRVEVATLKARVHHRTTA